MVGVDVGGLEDICAFCVHAYKVNYCVTVKVSNYHQEITLPYISNWNGAIYL